MIDLYYFAGIIIFIMFIPSLLAYVRTTKFSAIYEIGGNSEGSKEKIVRKKDRPGYLGLLQFGFTIIFAMSWLAIGLFSTHWMVFLGVLGSYLLLAKIFKNIGNKDKVNYIRTFLYLLVYIFMSLSILFISLNHFYFHQDLTTVVKSFIGL